MTTPILGLNELASSQAVPEETVNENGRWFEFFATGGAIADRDLATPPGSPSDGDAYLVAANGTGDWVGQDGKIALRIGTAWEFVPASEGMQLFVKDEDVRIEYDGAAWAASGGGGSSSTSVTQQTGTSYTFGIDDADSVVEFDNASAITVTVPPNSSVAFALGTFIEIHQIGAGTVTVAAGSGVILLSRGSLLGLAGQEAVAGLRKVAADTWRLTGDIA